jgi:hypothetical protein
VGAVQAQAYALVGKLASGLPVHERAFCLTQPLSLAEGTNVGEMQLGKVGRWHHTEYGEFEITEEDIDSCIAVFAEQQTPAMFDWNHGSTIKGATAEQGKASGWIRSLVKRVGAAGAELWADVVEWTDEAADKIRKREYQFSSPVLLCNALDRASGKTVRMRLFNAALTNVPFLDGMAAARLSEIAAGDEDDEKPKAPPAGVETPAAATEGEEPIAGTPGPDGETPPVEKLDEPAQEPGAEPVADAPEPGAASGEETAGATSNATATQALIDDLAKAADVDGAAIVDLLRRHTDGFVKAIREILDRERSQAASQTQQVAMSEQTPNAEAEARLRALEAKQVDSQLIALSERTAAIEADNKRRADADAARIKSMVIAKVDGLIKSGHVRPEGKEDAIWAFTEHPERAAKMYGVQLVPVGTSQAGDAETVAPTAAPGTLKLSEIGDAATRQCALTLMQMTHLGEGGKTLKLSEHDACAKAITEIKKVREARKAG